MGVARKRFPEYSRSVIRSRRWKALRLQALRRDGFQCVQCGARTRLEVDHIEPVRDAPERAFDLDNLQTLCAADHALKTRVETGRAPLPTERLQWRDLLRKDTPHA